VTRREDAGTEPGPAPSGFVGAVGGGWGPSTPRTGGTATSSPSLVLERPHNAPLVHPRRVELPRIEDCGEPATSDERQGRLEGLRRRLVPTAPRLRTTAGVHCGHAPLRPVSYLTVDK